METWITFWNDDEEKDDDDDDNDGRLVMFIKTSAVPKSKLNPKTGLLNKLVGRRVEKCFTPNQN